MKSTFPSSGKEGLYGGKHVIVTTEDKRVLDPLYTCNHDVNSRTRATRKRALKNRTNNQGVAPAVRGIAPEVSRLP